MLALYRSGRQADALEVYRRTRQRLVESFGIEPGRELRQLERAILNQDASLGAAATLAPVGVPEQIVLVLPSGDDRLDAFSPSPSLWHVSRDVPLLVARLLRDERLLASTAAALAARRASLAV